MIIKGRKKTYIKKYSFFWNKKGIAITSTLRRKNIFGALCRCKYNNTQPNSSIENDETKYSDS